jgi:hypothetical protein
MVFPCAEGEEGNACMHGLLASSNSPDTDVQIYMAYRYSALDVCVYVCVYIYTCTYSTDRICLSVSLQFPTHAVVLGRLFLH